MARNITRLELAGCRGPSATVSWCPRSSERSRSRNPARPLSMHAWGLAIDCNSRDNPLGARPVMAPEVVEVFRRWGFSWGGDWRRPDGMHFELERIVFTG